MKIFFMEVFVMLFFVLIIGITKIINKRSKDTTKKNRKEISDIFKKFLFSEELSTKEALKIFSIPNHLNLFRDLIEVMEQIDQTFMDQKWQLLKEKVFNDYLREAAKKNSFSRYWFTRQLAGRAFLFSPRRAPVDCLSHLLEDSRFLIRIVASIGIINSPYKELFSKMIGKMSEESSLSQYPYRDALIEADNEKFIWMEELLETSKDEKVVNICIDVLSTRTWHRLPDLVEPYLCSPNKLTRMLSIKALGSVASEKSIRILKKHLQDSDWEIRAESIISLKNLHLRSLANDLEPFLEDPSWFVRQQAAIALKSFGEQGQNILKRQREDQTPNAYEISQYILAMP